MIKVTFCQWIKSIFSIGTLTGVFFILSLDTASCANIVINHTNWDWYNSQSQAVVNRVALQKIFFTHASVGGNVMNGFAALHDADASKYPLVQVSADAISPDSTTNGTIYDYDRGNPDWSLKVSDFDTYIDNGWHDTKVNIAMNKFCFIDQAADWTVYRDSMIALESQYPSTTFIYWTMPLTTDSDADAVLRAQFNQNLRGWIATQDNKLFLDIADIEAWDPANTHHTFVSGSYIYEKMYSGYTDDGGHLNATGSERVATGLYSLFGQIIIGVKNDINNDGISDMLWRNATTGQMTAWLMNSNGTRSGYKTIITNTDWTVVGTGLINRDGITDIVARQISTGQVSIWFMKSDGTRLSNRAVVTASAWDVVGTGDFNTDGITDILVRAPSTGQVNIWFMNANGTRSSSKAILTSTAWEVKETGDFNVDGVTDILARAPSTGQVNIWFMNSNGTRLNSRAVVTAPAWDIVGTGDFNGDGIIDILARASSTGQTNIWFMNADGTRKGYKNVVTSTDWTPVGTLDINADGISDIVAKSTTGKVNLWFMNADGTRSSYRTLLDNPDWTPVP